MSRLVATVSTILAVVLAIASLLFLLTGRHFFAGVLLTFVAFAIYLREINTD